jgi:hypothetical protein
MIAPTFKIKNVEIDVPISYGMAGGGFYLVGDDRKTPDGARVSELENKLMNGEDAASGSWLEFGERIFPYQNKRDSIWSRRTLLNGSRLENLLRPEWRILQ